MASKKPNFFQKIRRSLRPHAEKPQSLAQPSQKRDGTVVVTTEVPSAGSRSDNAQAIVPSIQETPTSHAPEDRGNDTVTARSLQADNSDTADANAPRNHGSLEFNGLKEYGTNANPSAGKVENLWDKAYQRLTEEHSSLVEYYERILGVEEAETAGTHDPDLTQNPSVSTGIAQAHIRLAALASKKLAAVEDSRLKMPLGSRTVLLKDGVDQVLTIIIAAKDFVSSAVSSEPHAALAWAGVSLLLPLLLHPTQQYDDAKAGLLGIPLIIRRYEVLDAVYRADALKTYEKRGRLKEDLEQKLMELYCKILQYQAMAICQWNRNPLYQYGRDVFKADGWAKLFKEITDLDAGCKEIAQTMDAGIWHISLENQNARLQNMLQDWCNHQQELLKELRDSMQRSLDLNEARRQERLKEEEQKEERACQQAFGPSYYLEHKARNPPRVPGTCKWFLEHEKFIQWQEEEGSRLLWISADPGCGKSVLARSLIDEDLLFASDKLPAVCYFFFKDGSAEQQGAAKCISALLHQLFEKRPHLIKHALGPYRKDGQKVSTLFSITWDILTLAAADPEAGDIILVLDALDECEEESRFLIIDALKSLYSDKERCQSMNLKFLVSSRPYDDIERRLRKLTSSFPSIRLRGEAESEVISQEINLVITKRVPEIALDLALPPDVESSLLTTLLAVPNRTYLWLHLILNEIANSHGKATVKRLQGLIRNLPKTVDAAYDSILSRATDIVLCRRLLHIVLAAVRPLTLEETNVALHLEQGMSSLTDLDLENEAHFEGTVRNLCGLFVSVVDRKVFLIHQTAREYLLRTDICTRHDSPWKNSFSPSESDSILAICCISFLRFSEFERDVEQINHEAECDSLEIDRPFLSYASESWTTHYKEDTSDEATADQAFDLCDPNSRHFCTWLHRFAMSWTRELISRWKHDWTHLMIATHFGFASMIRKILGRGDCIEESGGLGGHTPLMVAANRGNAAIVRLLLEAGASTSAVDANRETALFRHDGSSADVPKLLIEFGADINHKGEYGTVLQQSVGFDADMELVRFLLTHEAIGINIEHGSFGTALQGALSSESMDIAKLLVEHGADVNLNGRDSDGLDGGFPIVLATQLGSKEMMQLLFDHGAKLDPHDGSAEAALSAAMEYSNLETLHWLLEHGADPRQKRLDERNSNFSIFELAAKVGNFTVLEFLVGYRPDLYPDSLQQALRAAMKYSHTPLLSTVLTLPLSREDLQSALDVGFETGDRRVSRAARRRTMILEKLHSMRQESF